MTAAGAAERVVPLVRRHRAGGCLLLPGAGGGLQPYLRLASVLGRTHDVYAVPPLGLLAGEVPERDVAAMADSVLAAVDAAGLAPTVVLGWSLGGVLGWEVCVRLADRGRRPDLVLVDAVPYPRPSTPAGDGRVEAEIRRGLGPNAGGPLVERVLGVFRGQVAALAGHSTERPYAGRVLLLVCAGGDPGDGDGPAARSPAALARWRQLAPELRVIELPAGHFEVFEPAHLAELAGAVSGFLGVPSEVAR